MSFFNRIGLIATNIATTLSWPQWIFVAVVLFFFWKFGFYIIRLLHRRGEYNDLVHMRVTLPRNDSKLDNDKRTEKDFHEQVGKAEQIFRALHETRDLNLYNVVMKRWMWKKPHFSFELQFEKQELTFVVVCDPYYQQIVQKQITSFYESADIEMLKEDEYFNIEEKGSFSNGYYLYTKQDFWYPIQTYKQLEGDALDNVANAFSKLNEDEKGVVQLIVHPRSHKWQRRAKQEGTDLFKNKKRHTSTIPFLGPLLRIIWLPFKILINGYDPAVDGGSNEPGASGGDHYVRMLQTEEEIAKSVGTKAIQSGFETVVRVMASSPSRQRTQDILNGIFVSFNAFKAKGMNRFENRRIIPLNMFNAPIMRMNFKYRLPSFLEKESLLCSEELATLYHFPDARYNKVPTIRWLKYKVLPPPINLPSEGVVLGKSLFRGTEKLVRFQKEDRTRHHYVIGKSGTGKSVLLWNMAVQDIRNGEGVCVIDPHGDLIDDIASSVPKERAKDIIIFDPSDRDRPMGLNLLEADTPEEQDRASLDAMEIFIKLFGNEIFGPRIQHYFRNGCLTLMSDEDEGATLIDIPRLFIDDDFQRYKVSKVKNPVVRAFWEHEMANTGDREKQEMIPYFTSKFGPFVTNTTMRNVIGQTKSAFNVRHAMDNQKVVLINLSKGKIGSINAQLLGLILVSKINMAAMGRADMAKEDRKDFYLYVDEFQNFATDTFASILSEARKYRLNLIMAHQYIAQLTEGAGGISVGQKDSKIKDAVFGNVGTMMSFKVGAEDGEYLEKEYAPVLSQQDIIGIANYKAYLKLNIDNTTSRPFSLETIYDPNMKNPKVLEILLKYSRMKYGRKKEFVDAEIEARMGIDNIDAINKAAAEDETVPDELLQDNAAISIPEEVTDHPEAAPIIHKMEGANPEAPKHLADFQKNNQPKAEHDMSLQGKTPAEVIAETVAKTEHDEKAVIAPATPTPPPSPQAKTPPSKPAQ